MMKLFYGLVLIIGVQVVSYFQTQAQSRWPFLKDYTFLMACLSVPIGYMIIKYTEIMNDHFTTTWQGRLIGQGVGIITFALMSYLVFKEPLTMKTFICILLSLSIILINIYWK